MSLVLQSLLPYPHSCQGTSPHVLPPVPRLPKRVPSYCPPALAIPASQYTPVASIATCVQPFTSSHSPNSIRLAVVVANVRTERDTLPPSTMRTHATTVSLCTSRPAQRGYITSMTSSPVASPACGTSIR